jgi:putative transposase
MSLRTGFPKFKKKNIKDSFYREGSIKISGYWVKLPRIGWVKSHEQLPLVNPKNVTISKRAGDWYISFKIDVEPQATPKVRERIGVDLGIKTLATLSDGKTYPNPKDYRPGEKKLAQLQKELNRRQKGGKIREKPKLKLAIVHRRIADIRADHLHKLTTY